MSRVFPRWTSSCLLLACLVAPLDAATIHVSSKGALPNDGIDDTAAINQAILDAAPGDIIEFASGTYDLITPFDANRFINLTSSNTVTLQGAVSGSAPTTKLLRHLTVENMASPPRTIYGVGGSGIIIKNFIVDNTPQLTTSGEITEIDPAGKFIKVKIFAGLPMEAGTACYAANVWNATTHNLKHVPSLTETSSPGNWTIDNATTRVMKLTNASGLSFLSNVAVGEHMSWHYGWNGRSQFEFAKVDGLTLHNLVVRNTVNMAILIGATNNITLTDITMRPDPSGNQLPVGPRDGIHISRSTGAIICDGLDITGVRLDGFVVRTPYSEITSITSPTQLRIKSELRTFNQPISAGSSVHFISSTGNLYTRVVTSSTYLEISDESYYDLVLQTDLPSFAAAGTPVKVSALGPSSVSITNSNFENIGGSSMILFADNITVDNVDNFNIMYPAIHMGSNSTAGVCGSNITIKNSYFDTCGWRTKGGHGGMITVSNDHSTYTQARLKNVSFENNIFTRQFFNSSYPSINVFDTDTLNVTGNLFENVYHGLKIDTSVSGFTVTGTTVIIDNDQNTSTYAELSGSFVSSTLPGYNGSSTRYAAVGAKAGWTFIAPKSANYRAYIYKPQNATSDTNAKITIPNAGTSGVVYVNYSTGTSGWVDLGVYSFTGGGSYQVTNERSNGYLRADAVMFVQQ